MVTLATRVLDFSEIPVVDLEPLSTDRGSIQSVVREIERACEDVGFMYIRNHGVSAATLSWIVDQATRFFALPTEEKASVSVAESPQFRGYLPLDYTGNEGEKGKNLQEGFMIMHEKPLGPFIMHGPNQWPKALPSLRPAMEGYFVEMEKLASSLLHVFAMAVGEKREFFDKFHKHDPMNVLKLNHYPPQEVVDETEIIGVGGHCDGGSFTILWQDSLGGLEVRNKSGEWVGVPPIEGTFVINVGNLLQLWTGGRFSSTEHRVINRYGKDRNSIAFFVYPSQETVILPIDERSGTKLDPVVCGEDMLTYFRRVYPQRATVKTIE